MQKLPKKIEIYGKENCPYCVNAKKLAAHLNQKHNNQIEIEYVDIEKSNLDRDELAKKLGIESVRTVPQIQAIYEDGQKEYLGGYTDFDQKADDKNWI